MSAFFNAHYPVIGIILIVAYVIYMLHKYSATPELMPWEGIQPTRKDKIQNGYAGNGYARKIRPFDPVPVSIQELKMDIGKRARFILPRNQEARARFIQQYSTMCVEELQIVSVEVNPMGEAFYWMKMITPDNKLDHYNAIYAPIHLIIIKERETK